MSSCELSVVGQAESGITPHLLSVYDIELLVAHDTNITSAEPVTMNRSCSGLRVVVIAL